MKFFLFGVLGIFFSVPIYSDSLLSDFPQTNITVVFPNKNVDDFHDIASYLTWNGDPWNEINRDKSTKILQEADLYSDSPPESPTPSQWWFKRRVNNGILVLKSESRAGYASHTIVELHLVLNEQLIEKTKTISVVPVNFSIKSTSWIEELVIQSIQPYLGKELFRITVPSGHPASVESLVALVFLLEGEVPFSDGSTRLNPTNDQCGISLEEARKIEEEKKKERRPF